MKKLFPFLVIAFLSVTLGYIIHKTIIDEFAKNCFEAGFYPRIIKTLGQGTELLSKNIEGYGISITCTPPKISN